MTLSDDDKKHIAEEEKERLKVRGELQAEKQKKKRKIPKWVPIGCGGLVVLIIIIIVIAIATSSKSTTTSTVSTISNTSSTQTTTPLLAFQPITFTSEEYPPTSTSIPNAFTAQFSIPTQDWAINWSYSPSQAIIDANEGGFSIFVYPTSGPRDTNTAVATVEGSSTSGSLDLSNVGPGQYQIEVITLYSWSMTVQPSVASGTPVTQVTTPVVTRSHLAITLSTDFSNPYFGKVYVTLSNNNADVTATDINVQVTFKNSSGTVLDIESCPATSGITIPPGQSQTFEVDTFSSLVMSQVANVTCYANTTNNW